MNKVVIVTGTSSGLDRAFAQALLEAGFSVVGTVRKPEAVQELEQLKPRAAYARVLDVTEAPERLASVIAINTQERGRFLPAHRPSSLHTFITSDVIAAVSHRARIGHRIEGAKRLI